MSIEGKWGGEWKAVREWIRNLFPSSLADSADAAEVPCSVEVHVGSRQQLGTTQPTRKVDVSEFEAEDAERRVLMEVEEIFDALGPERSTILLQLKPTHLDGGVEKVWGDRGNLVRSFSRVMAQPSAQSPFAAGRNPEGVAVRRTVSGITPPNMPAPAQTPQSAIQQGWNAASQGSRPTSLEAMVGTDPMLRGNVDNQSVWLYLVQHQSSEIRFLIEQCVGMMGQVIGVTDNMARAAVADSSRKGKAVEDMVRQVSVTEREAEKSKAQLAAEAKLALRETEIRDMELARYKAELRAAQGQAENERKAREEVERRVEREATKKTKKKTDGEEESGGFGDVINKQLEGAAGQFMQQVVGGLGGALAQGAGAPGAPATEPAPTQAPAPQARRGVVVNRKPAVAPAPAAAAAPGGGPFDPNTLSPEQMAMGLMMLTPEKRKAAIAALTRMSRDTALDIAETAASEVDIVDGVDNDEDDDADGEEADDETGEEGGDETPDADDDAEDIGEDDE